MDDTATPSPLDRCLTKLRDEGVGASSIRTLFVPGRVEILGKHTDYCGGRSAVCAIDRGFHIAYAPREDARVQLHALDVRDCAEFDMSPHVTPTIGHWSNYPMSVARRLARNFPAPLCGATIACTSTLPQAAGMSSSSALVVGMFLLLDAINGFTERMRSDGIVTTPTQLAEYLGTIENGRAYGSLVGDRGVGTFGGSEDHTAITLGRRGQISVYGFSPTQHERDVPMPADHVLVIATSGVIAEKTGAARGRYNRASSLVGALVELWNAHAPAPSPTLASIVRSEHDAAARLRALIQQHAADPEQSASLTRRLDHFLAESEKIIPAAMQALAVDDARAFGDQVERSQSLANSLLLNQVDETIFLAKSARNAGAMAASAFGAGFGGSVWSMLHRDDATAFIERWSSSYRAAFPAAAAHAKFFVTQPSDGTAAAAAATHAQTSVTRSS